MTLDIIVWGGLAGWVVAAALLIHADVRKSKAVRRCEAFDKWAKATLTDDKGGVAGEARLRQRYVLTFDMTAEDFEYELSSRLLLERQRAQRQCPESYVVPSRQYAPNECVATGTNQHVFLVGQRSCLCGERVL